MGQVTWALGLSRGDVFQVGWEGTGARGSSPLEDLTRMGALRPCGRGRLGGMEKLSPYSGVIFNKDEGIKF